MIWFFFHFFSFYLPSNWNQTFLRFWINQNIPIPINHFGTEIYLRKKSKWDGSGFNISKHPFKLGPHEHIQHKKGSPSIFYLGKRPKLVALPMPTHPIRLGLFGTQKMIFKSIFWIKDIDLSTGHFTLARYEGALRKVLSRTRDRLQKSRGLAKWLKVWQNWSKLLVGIFSSKTKSRILTSLPDFLGPKK